MSPLAELIENGVLCPRAARLRMLYVCTGNSCRSQMAEGWTRDLLSCFYAEAVLVEIIFPPG